MKIAIIEMTERLIQVMDAINWRILPNLRPKDRFWIQAFHKKCFEFDNETNVASGETLQKIEKWMKTLDTGKLHYF